MGITDTLEDIVTTRWKPGERFTLDQITEIALDHKITDAAPTVRRTMQELRERDIVHFIDDRGNYMRLSGIHDVEIANEDTPIRHQILAAQNLRDNPNAHEAERRDEASRELNRLGDMYERGRATTLDDVPEIVQAVSKRTEAAANVMTRLGQGKFRDELISYWGKCAVTGCRLLPTLRASHIKPWRVSDDDERLDHYNGLLLIPNADALFDAGLISFRDDGRILISEILNKDSLKLFQMSRRITVEFEDRHHKYLAYHRDNVFLGHVASAP